MPVNYDSHKKSRLCFIIPTLGRGGAEKNLVTVINNLDRKRFEVFLICLSATGSNLSKLDQTRLTLIDVCHPSIYLSILKLRRAVKQVAPDVVIGWMGYLNAYLIFFKFLFPSSIKWVCRESSIASIQNAYFKYPFFFTFLYGFLNRYNHIICQSKAMAEDLVNHFGVKKERITIINNPGNFESLLPVNHQHKQEEIKRLLYVGNLSKEKRVHLLIEALALLPHNYQLTILGEGTELNLISEKVGELRLSDRIFIEQDCFNPFPYYAAADCLLLCSNHEGFPNVLIEAMGAGCPAIGFNIAGGANEILTQYGGFIVAEPDMPTFVNCIRKVCEFTKIDRNQIAETARNSYNTEKIIDCYQQVFS